MDVSILPTVNAVLNSTSAILLVCGLVMIKQRKVAQHRAFMVAAFVTSILFLISYLTYHAAAGSTRYQGFGMMRTVYFTILISHTILAATVPFLAIITLVQAWKERFDNHRRIARWTFPIWLYVSVTGVVIYLMLY